MIKVYYTKVFPFLEEDTFFSHLNKIEKERRRKLLAISSEKNRLRSLTAGCLLHEVLCRELGLLKENEPPFEVAYEKDGKPYLLDYPNVYFNLSHSGDYVCCAVGDMPLGVDIQKITDVKEGVARRFFTDEDNQRLAACGGEERKKLFFRMWSIKESYIKLTGRGMAGGLNTFEIDWQENRILGISALEIQEKAEGSEKAEAYFEEYSRLPEYCFCVCASIPFYRVTWKEIQLTV